MGWWAGGVECRDGWATYIHTGGGVARWVRRARLLMRGHTSHMWDTRGKEDYVDHVRYVGGQRFVWWGAVRYSGMRCDAVWWGAMLCGGVRCCVVGCGAVWWDAVRCVTTKGTATHRPKKASAPERTPLTALKRQARLSVAIRSSESMPGRRDTSRAGSTWPNTSGSASTVRERPCSKPTQARWTTRRSDNGAGFRSGFCGGIG